jgi:hypothetical protein
MWAYNLNENYIMFFLIHFLKENAVILTSYCENLNDSK